MPRKMYPAEYLEKWKDIRFRLNAKKRQIRSLEKIIASEHKKPKPSQKTIHSANNRIATLSEQCVKLAAKLK